MSTVKFTDPMLLMLARSEDVSTEVTEGRDPFEATAAATAAAVAAAEDGEDDSSHEFTSWSEVNVTDASLGAGGERLDEAAAAALT